MDTSISLAKKTLIFYSILTVPIAFGSFYNLVYGLILGQTSTARIGLFSLFGFVLLPALIISTYRRNKCIIQNNKVIIGKKEYPFADYNFKIVNEELAFKDRPLVSLLKSQYQRLLIIQRDTNEVELNQELDILKKDLEQLKSRLPLLT